MMRGKGAGQSDGRTQERKRGRVQGTKMLTRHRNRQCSGGKRAGERPESYPPEGKTEKWRQGRYRAPVAPQCSANRRGKAQEACGQVAGRLGSCLSPPHSPPVHSPGSQEQDTADS